MKKRRLFLGSKGEAKGRCKKECNAMSTTVKFWVITCSWHYDSYLWQTPVVSVARWWRFVLVVIMQRWRCLLTRGLWRWRSHNHGRWLGAAAAAFGFLLPHGNLERVSKIFSTTVLVGFFCWQLFSNPAQTQFKKHKNAGLQYLATLKWIDQPFWIMFDWVKLPFRSRWSSHPLLRSPMMPTWGRWLVEAAAGDSGVGPGDLLRIDFVSVW